MALIDSLGGYGSFLPTQLQPGNARIGRETPVPANIKIPSSGNTKTAGGDAPSFGDMVNRLVESVDEKSKVAGEEARKVLTGEADNLHQSMIAMQESSLAFTTLTEVRNKLVESYKELVRIAG